MIERSKATDRVKSLVVAAILLAVPLAALAHQGLYEAKDTTGPDDAIELVKPHVSYAAYMGLDRPGDVDWVRFEVDSPMKLKASLLVPQRPEFLDFYPAFAVVGPGLPAPEADLPFDLPEGCGAAVLISEPKAEREKFHEPFSNTHYYRGFEEFEQEVTVPGTYYIVVWHPAGEYGDYVVTYGEKESFTTREMINTYRVIYKVWTGKWGRTRGGADSE